MHVDADNSNIMEQSVVPVWFSGTDGYKKDYRHFNIKTVSDQTTFPLWKRLFTGATKSSGRGNDIIAGDYRRW
jgi:excinuclease UvrABC nuclease subunit